MNGLLELREKLENQEKVAYGIARQKLTTEEERLHGLEAQKISYELRYRNLCQSKLNIVEIKQVQVAIENKKNQIKEQKIKVQNAEKSLEVARIKLNQAMKDRKTIEILKENAFEQFKKDLESAEQKEIDELVSFVYNTPAGYEED